MVINSNGFGNFLIVKGSGFNMKDFFSRQKNTEDFIKMKVNGARPDLT